MASRFKLFVVVLVAGVAIDAGASAATVTYVLDLTGPPGTFILSASASKAFDNSGIAKYGIPLTGPILTLDHRTPNAITSVTFQSVGFTTVRTADGFLTVVSAQQPDRPSPQITGFGLEGSNWAAKLGAPPVGSSDPTSDNPWSAPLVIATGTYNASEGLPGFNLISSTLLASVYAINNTSIRMSAVVNTIVVPPGLRGDYNNSGTVDAADYVLWRNGGPLKNDSTPGVQPADYTVWRANFGTTAGSGGALTSVPEPSTILLTIAALAVLCTRRRKFVPHSCV